MAYTIALVNTKGGVGKSTTAVNLAEAFRRDGYNALLVDSDYRRGTAKRWHDLAVARHTDRYAYVSVVTADNDLPRLMRQFGEIYDVILVDAPAYLDKLITSLVALADLVLMPIQPSAPDLWACEEAIRWIDDRQMITGGLPDARFLLSRCHPDERVNREEVDEIVATGVPVLTTRIVQRVAYARTLKAGQTVFDLPPADKAHQEFLSLYQEIPHGRPEPH